MNFECYIWRNKYLLFKKEDLKKFFKEKEKLSKTNTIPSLSIEFSVHCDMSNNLPEDFYLIDHINKDAMPAIDKLNLEYDWQGFKPAFENHFNYKKIGLTNIPKE